ncbi:acetyl-CoA carboxylase biotin carboxyl carrier protein [Parafilimonas sp.]|uniref:acetyl-CoA carboxylase biotin carboxyl carrier protein n=1 Tax=Parafilimonas sp. TaxID=1969739 RepID=UPI0039E4B65E
MDYKQVQELIKLINKSNIGELSIEEKDFKILIKQKRDKVYQAEIQQVPVQVPVYQPQAALQPTLPAAVSTTPSETAAQKADNLITIKSPMIGTFYKRPSPDKPNFVEVGDEIAPGKVVCIIEAMKLFNEIESEISGRVAKILVEDASPVEYDQPLFLVEP